MPGQLHKTTNKKKIVWRCSFSTQPVLDSITTIIHPHRVQCNVLHLPEKRPQRRYGPMGRLINESNQANYSPIRWAIWADEGDCVNLLILGRFISE